MLPQESHLTDQELVLAADCELPPARAAQVAAHLSKCWPCRARKQEMEQAIVDFVHLHRGRFDPLLPSGTGPRALLKARLAERVSSPEPRRSGWSEVFAWRQAAAVLLFAAIAVAGYRYWATAGLSRAALPEPRLTPGAVSTINREQVCSIVRADNLPVSPSLQRKVFEEYGIPNAEPRAYEVDYLITPALGGSDDIRNLWPQRYSATTWNAHVKDALEERLRELVCSGQLDLATAQHEISSDWIAAYRKYFHTNRPLEIGKAE
jgi:hypothetical protein